MSMRPVRTMRQALVIVVIGLLVPALVGCGGYRLRGRVIEGSYSTVTVVSKDDPRLREAPGLPNAVLRTTIDPERLNRQAMPTRMADGDGWFEVPIDVTGAGLLEYEVQVIGQLAGHKSAIETFPLPGSGKRVLVVLAPGRDVGVPGETFLEETMRLGEPYR